MEPYIEARVHMNWRWNYNTGGGQLLDWIGHHCDIAHWGLGFDNAGPSEIRRPRRIPARRRHLEHLHQVPHRAASTPRTSRMIIAGGYDDIRSGAKWIGTDGWVWVDRGGYRRLQSRLVREDPRGQVQGQALPIGRTPSQLH